MDLRRERKRGRDRDGRRRCGGREFQQRGPETQKPRNPKDFVEWSGIKRSDREADRRWDRPDKEAVGMQYCER